MILKQDCFSLTFCNPRDSYFWDRLYFIVSGEPKFFLFVWLVVFACIISILRLSHGSRLLLELQPLNLYSHQQIGGREKEGYDPSPPFLLISLGPELRHKFLHLAAERVKKTWSLFCTMKMKDSITIEKWEEILSLCHRITAPIYPSHPILSQPLLGFRHISAFILIL